VQHRQEAEVGATEKRERAVKETAATAARAARLAMVELTAARAEVEAAAAVGAGRAVAAELGALCASSTGSSVSTDDDRDNELKLAREATREQAAQWAAVHPQERRGGSPDRHGRAGGTPGGVRATTVSPMAAAVQTSGAALPPRAGTMVTMGSSPLSGTSIPAVGGLPSPRPTTSSEPR
jgi:hypothetical protein